MLSLFFDWNICFESTIQFVGWIRPVCTSVCVCVCVCVSRCRNARVEERGRVPTPVPLSRYAAQVETLCPRYGEKHTQTRNIPWLSWAWQHVELGRVYNISQRLVGQPALGSFEYKWGKTCHMAVINTLMDIWRCTYACLDIKSKFQLGCFIVKVKANSGGCLSQLQSPSGAQADSDSRELGLQSNEKPCNLQYCTCEILLKCRAWKKGQNKGKQDFQ